MSYDVAAVYALEAARWLGLGDAGASAWRRTTTTMTWTGCSEGWTSSSGAA